MSLCIYMFIVAIIMSQFRITEYSELLRINLRAPRISKISVVWGGGGCPQPPKVYCAQRLLTPPHLFLWTQCICEKL